MDHVISRHRQARPGARNPQSEPRHEQRTEPTTRDVVAAHFRACARGVAAAVAHARTQRFYRASGHPWTAALA
jgi:hypothetical protein